jgi:hypothetical protein
VDEQKCDTHMQWNIIQPYKEILTHAAIWKNFDEIMIIEISQLHKDK